MKFIKTDGGRAASGFKGTSGDCVCRAVAIASGASYSEVYQSINNFAATERHTKRKGKSSARDGVYKRTTRQICEAFGGVWTACMGIGTGCKVHLHDGELPMGRLVVSVSKHMTAVIDGVVHDMHDPQRLTTYVDAQGNPTGRTSRRCVYGYFAFPPIGGTR